MFRYIVKISIMKIKSPLTIHQVFLFSLAGPFTLAYADSIDAYIMRKAGCKGGAEIVSP